MASQTPINHIRRTCHLYKGAAPSTVFAVYLTFYIVNILVPLFIWSLIVSLTTKRCPKLILRCLLRHKSVRFTLRFLLPVICLCLWIYEGFALHAALGCRHQGFRDDFHGFMPTGGWVAYGLQGLAILATWMGVVTYLNREMSRYRRSRCDSERDALAPSRDVEHSRDERAPLGPNAMPSGLESDRSSSVSSTRPTHFYWEGIDTIVSPNPKAIIGNGTVSSSRGHYRRYANPDLASTVLRRNYERATSPTRVPLPVHGNGEGSSRAVEQAAAKLTSLVADEQGFPFPLTPGPKRSLSQEDHARNRSRSRNGAPHLKPGVLETHQDRHRRMARRSDRSATLYKPHQPSPLRVQSAPASDIESIDLETDKTETMRGRGRRRFAWFPLSHRSGMSTTVLKGQSATTRSSSPERLERYGLVPRREGVFVERTQSVKSDAATTGLEQSLERLEPATAVSDKQSVTQFLSPSMEPLEHTPSEIVQPSTVPDTEATTRSPSPMKPLETARPTSTSTVPIGQSTTWPPKTSTDPLLIPSTPTFEPPTRSPSPPPKARSDSGVGVDSKELSLKQG